LQHKKRSQPAGQAGDAGPLFRRLAFNDWVYLNPGDEVVVQRVGRSPYQGWVDDINDDASVFWVWLNDGRGRILVHAGDDSIIMRRCN
jgi:hypothetical protein